MKCEYGCGREAKYQFKNGKWCCENYFSKCPYMMKQTSKHHVGMFGKNHSHKSKIKMSESQLTRFENPEERKKCANKNKGKQLSEEHRRKIGEGNKGRIFSKETIEKIKQNNLGQKRSIEARNNISKAQKKRNNIPENTANWQGGITPINYKIRNSFEYEQWRQSVLQRDNYTCQVCSNNKSIIVHHIKTFSKYPEFRFDINNGITLCKKYHCKIKGKEKDLEDLFYSIIGVS